MKKYCKRMYKWIKMKRYVQKFANYCPIYVQKFTVQGIKKMCVMDRNKSPRDVYVWGKHEQ